MAWLQNSDIKYTVLIKKISQFSVLWLYKKASLIRIHVFSYTVWIEVEKRSDQVSVGIFPE